MAAHDRHSFAHQLAYWRDYLAAGWNTLRMPGRSYRGPLPPADERLRMLADQLREHVVKLAEDIGERNVQYCPRQLEQAADYIEQQFHAAGHVTLRHAYEVDRTTCWNLVAEVAGASRPEEVVVVGAHYDSVHDSPAANDNGSGIAALLSLAAMTPPEGNERTLRFVAFANEEAPYAHTALMGSRVYARQCRQRHENIVGMMSLETMGYYSDVPGSQKYPPLIKGLYPSAGNFIAFVGNTASGKFVRRAVAIFRRHEPFPCQGGVLPASIPNIGYSDHWSFWQENYPALMVTDTAPFRYPHYHTAEDTVDKIDFEKLARVVRGLQHVITDLVR